MPADKRKALECLDIPEHGHSCFGCGVPFRCTRRHGLNPNPDGGIGVCDECRAEAVPGPLVIQRGLNIIKPKDTEQ